MILLSVITGYILGIAPFTIPKIIEIIENNIRQDKNIENDKTQAEILDEWLNGPRKDNNDNDKKINQEDILNEYLTGIESTKGD